MVKSMTTPNTFPGVGMKGGALKRGNPEFERVKAIRGAVAREFVQEFNRVANDPVGVLSEKIEPNSVKCAMAHLIDWAAGKHGL